MRTTLVIDDDLAQSMRQAAAEAGCTVSELVARAVRSFLQRRPARDEGPFRMVTFGGRGRRHVEPREMKVVLADDEAERARR